MLLGLASLFVKAADDLFEMGHSSSNGDKSLHKERGQRVCSHVMIHKGKQKGATFTDWASSFGNCQRVRALKRG